MGNTFTRYVYVAYTYVATSCMCHILCHLMSGALATHIFKNSIHIFKNHNNSKKTGHRDGIF